MPRNRLGLLAGVAGTALLFSSLPARAQSLGAASSYAVHGAAGVTAAGGLGTIVAGDVGSSPNASITGFPPAVVVPPFGLHANDGPAVAAHAAAVTLFAALGSGACDDFPLPQMSGVIFGPGIHCFAAAADLATLGNVTLTGPGTIIFRIPTALTANVGSTVTLIGLNPCDVFWQIGTAATLNGINFPGNVVSQAGSTLGVSAALTGRALATVGPVTLSGSNIVGGCSLPPPPLCPTINVFPANLPNGTVGVAYNQTITANGGTPPYTFAVTAGALPAGLDLIPAGQLSGTPTLAGSFNFTVQATDDNGCFRQRAYTLVIAAAPPPPPVCPAITISPATLPNGTAGVAYNQTITASGGQAPYRFGVTAGTLPMGLALTAAGQLTGTPTTGGSSMFTVRGTDENGCFQQRAYTLVIAAAPPPPPVCPTILISPATLPDGTVGVAYQQTITGSGGQAPYTFGVTNGALPAGLTLTAAGVLSGTPTVKGSATFTVRGTDANGCFMDRTYTFVIAPRPPPPPVCPTITLAPATLPNGKVAVAYNQSITASGGTAPYMFGVTAGTLPPGLTLTAAGVLVGTPTIAGSFTFTVRGMDANGCFDRLRYTMVIAPAAPPPPVCPTIVLSPAPLPDGALGVPYDQTISGSGGTAPYSFGVTTGALPAGLALTAEGVLSGTPNTAGTSAFTIRGTDANECFQEVSFTVTVFAVAPVPTLAGWTMILLTALLALTGISAMRRRET